MSSQDECETKECEENAAGPTPCEKICIHHGGRICYNDLGDKGLVKKIEGDENSSKSTESLDVDSIHSGESLFKTFTFDAQDSDPDIEKCMSFWKCILEKNIKPVKCTLLRKPVKKEEKIVKEETKVEEIHPCDREDTRTMWLEIYEELKRKKLDKIKLGKTKKCDPCDEYIDDEYEKKQEVEDIKNLNKWKSQTKPSHLSTDDIKSQVKRALNEFRSRKSSSEPITTIPKETQVPPQPAATKTATKSKSSSVTSKNLNPVKIDKVIVEEIKTPTSIKKESLKAPITPTIATPIIEEKKTEVVEVTDVKTAPQSPTAEIEQIVEEPPPKEIKEEEITIMIDGKVICCSCGCDMDECVCAEFPDLQVCDKIVDKCYACECDNVNKTMCKCGCAIDECCCDELGTKRCVCGCAVDECICDKIDELPCFCGCGQEECMCEQLLENPCRCGHEDCTCDIIQILSTYMGTLETPGVKTNPDNLSKEAQTDCEAKFTLKETQVEGRYCIICGHYNCFCKVSKSLF